MKWFKRSDGRFVRKAGRFLAMVAIAMLALPGGAVRVASATDGGSITETCNGSPQNYVYAPQFNVGSVKQGDTYEAKAWWYTGCDGAPWGFIFRRVVLRAPVGHTIYGYYWVDHGGTHSTYGCSTNYVNNRHGVVCNEVTEINGAITGTNPGPVVALVRVDTNSPCNVGVMWDTTLRHHNSPWAQLHYQTAYLSQTCV